MTGSFAIEPLRSSHDRQRFRCGVPVLDRYLREQASQDIRRRLSNCFVAIDAAGTVAAYYTLAATGLPMTELPPDQARTLPRYPVLPAALLGRLAVAEDFRGQGLGGALLVDAVTRAVRSESAIFALLVDAKDEAAKCFYLHHGFLPFVSRPQSLFLTIAAAIQALQL